ncbi:PIN domain-like protein [Gloeophyllum trabeum ATCC 11539]|uniref:PIN domain-like protein n=1 Tax=Gloeophyllum trabeum (strain ATCC 11539 / FP-39264 / Madison 617) TaxID=670483 RepID=S7RI13_GLOTA|nr:PIN domain-like protein [Gloeophyllum trabeum ATCC 11539]EPQ52244.1 PIN domain-like protein [Gloeophyllum trabeum ATCC 11539]
MGVLGLVPFLQKICPQVVQTLPNRLRHLSGKTIVLDGTLITQRLHFAPAPHRYRHVLGWYRLVRELRNSEVRAICVFDGKERSGAKRLEIERRRHIRKIDAARASVEVDRFQRLKKLKRLLNACRGLEAAQREQATSTLRRLIAEIPDSAIASSVVPPSQAVSSDISSGWPLRSPATSQEGSLYEFLEDRHIEEALNDQASVTSSNAQADAWLKDFLMPAEQTEPSISSEAIPDALAALYLDYRRSIPTVQSLMSMASNATAAHTPSATTDVTEVSSEYAMSKSQHQLMLDEGKVWLDLADFNPDPREEGMNDQNLISLAERSQFVSQSYERRCNPPTAETYKESQLILRAMGVPCVESSGPYEAEALASSLVIHGYADYVATEDTDVLVYEAPMIRNITSRKDPLVLLSGSEIRSVLHLDRSSYIDFVLLLGTDFSQRIKNVGPHRALKFIRQHGSIEGVIEHEKQFPPRVAPQAYLQQVQVARLAFTTLPPLPDPEELRQKEWDNAQVRSLLERFGLLRATAAYFLDDWDYQEALAGNYFNDKPSSL